MSEIAENGNWDEDFAPKEQKSNENSEDQKRVPWMHRWWSPFTTRIITHLSYKDEDPAWNAGFWPRKTFAIHVIDRADGQLKILEKGQSIFGAFADFKATNNINPAGKSGHDFVIKVEWPGGNKRQAKYTVSPVISPSPWTEEEVAMIKEQHADLKKIYAPTPLEKIKEAWDALPEDAKIPPKREGEESKSVPSEKAPAPAPAPAPVETVAVNDDDDLFGDNDDSTGF
jgi:hypothetical protein